MNTENTELGYRKAEEWLVSSYPKANKLADEVFSPFTSQDGRSRTSPEAKVRIRRTNKQGKDWFRVVLSKRQEAPAPKKEESTKKRPRARKDRKGK